MVKGLRCTCTSICLYSPLFSPVSVWLLVISFLSMDTTSSMLRAVMRSNTMSNVLRRMSRLGDATLGVQGLGFRV